MKEEKVPAETVLLSKEFQWSMTREKKDNFEEFKRTEGLQSMNRLPRVTLNFSRDDGDKRVKNCKRMGKFIAGAKVEFNAANLKRRQT